MSGGTHFGPYRVTSRLGAGGMGEVFRAVDPRLNREVAIKVLPADRSNPEAAARLAREARLVAALNHPGILTIHDVGEEDGQFYLVTELLEGETLRQRLGGGALPWRTALEFSNTIASALAAAHARGVVHRDLKPDNIFCLSSGSVKILDFGIAKFVAPANAATATAPVANTKGAFGTVAYMSPEQAEGREVDHRTDQYSFGVVMHEMLAGQKPVDGSTLPSGIPAPFARIVARCLARDPQGRYASTADLSLALEDVRTDVHQPVSAVAPARTKLAWIAGGLALAALVTAGAFALNRGRAAGPAQVSLSAGEEAVAVLPFTTLGGGETYVADGITEAVTRELGRVEHIRVLASNVASSNPAPTERLGEIGRGLGVTWLVRGSVQRSGTRIRISAALVDVHDVTLWSDRYDRDSVDVLAIQDEIAWQIASKLATASGRAIPARPSPTIGTTPAAYDAYLRALSHLNGRSAIPEDKRLAAATEEFERAVSLDGNFALARARLASVYTQRFFYDATDPGFEEKAFLEIEKALAINPDLPEAYLARAQLTWNVRNGFQHERAVADLRRAIAGNPSLTEAYIELGKIYLHIGLVEKSIKANDDAARLDPNLPGVSRKLAALVDVRMANRVREEIDRNPQIQGSLLAQAHLILGHPEEALKTYGRYAEANDTELQKMEPNNLAQLGVVYGHLGRTADAERVLRAAIPKAVNPTGLSDIHHIQYAIGQTLAILGRADEAVRWLTKAANEGYPSYPKFSQDPDLFRLKGHTAFDALLERLREDHERWMKTL